ncbi:hypothetical protein QBC34DRAFT_460036 [Podospora aff. communis PSN243]|uniref:Uncharacterized protein n=1 Tax=Podospora aff. communis PSN243 TaxID=3040156 RepID=A0AAV9GTX4_9PEZI|nr:hypothetical protein QBC34DRAFT_460036 [Podospora aff. communis PSN243]
MTAALHVRLSWALLATIFLGLTKPATAANTPDDFPNNLATDLAPLVALFGEQATKRFLSETTTIWDSIIFTATRIGILTAVVSVIREDVAAYLSGVLRESKSQGGRKGSEGDEGVTGDIVE